MKTKIILAVIALTALIAFCFVPVSSASAHSHDATPNPWGYYFSTSDHGLGSTPVIIFAPNKDICNGKYFHCTSDFWKKTNGYVVQCKDGLLSHSGGIAGACSRDRGVLKPLLQDLAICASRCQANGGYSSAERALLTATYNALHH